MNGRLVLALRTDLGAEHLAWLHREFPQADFRVCATSEALTRELRQADALIGGWSITPEMLNGAPRLRWIHATSTGVENFLIPELRRRSIVLTNAGGVLAPPIAEHILALMLFFARGLWPLLRGHDQHHWRMANEVAPPVFELQGQTLGIVGLGHIGNALAQKAYGLGMRVLAVRRHIDQRPAYVERLFPRACLPELLGQADHVALCLPLTEATKGIIGPTELRQMRCTAYIYNIGRGDAIDQEALLTALQRGLIAGAGLDVTTPEPLPAVSPLWDAPNTVITAHSAGRTPNAWNRSLPLLAENILHFLNGEPLGNIVDLEGGY